MPKVRANGITINYDQQGNGEPLVLIPFLTADHGCYAFQVADYSKHFTCISIDLRGTGESDAPTGAYSTADLADDVAAFMQAVGIDKAHVAGLSLGAAVGMWLAARHPDKVQSLGLHGGWPKTDRFLETVVRSWQRMAMAIDSVPETTVQCILPWCLSPELYAARPDYIDAIVAFIRSRPAESVDAFIQQSTAVIGHDVEQQLPLITVPTQITFGASDRLVYPRFAEPMREAIRGSELLVFESSAHAALYEEVEIFNRKTLEFLMRHAGVAAA